jgi:hypothetical protein
MGNVESAYDDSHDDFQSHPPSYAGSSTDTHYRQKYADAHDDLWIHPPSYAGSSTDTHYRQKQQTTCIPDNFKSLDQVFTVTLTC